MTSRRAAVPVPSPIDVALLLGGWTRSARVRGLVTQRQQAAFLWMTPKGGERLGAAVRDVHGENPLIFEGLAQVQRDATQNSSASAPLLVTLYRPSIYLPGLRRVAADMATRRPAIAAASATAATAVYPPVSAVQPLLAAQPPPLRAAAAAAAARAGTTPWIQATASRLYMQLLAEACGVVSAVPGVMLWRARAVLEVGAGVWDQLVLATRADLERRGLLLDVFRNAAGQQQYAYLSATRQEQLLYPPVNRSLYVDAGSGVGESGLDTVTFTGADGEQKTAWEWLHWTGSRLRELNIL